MWSYNPLAALTSRVWALPLSLATTYGITIVFSSSGYLDVSVLRVCFLLPGCIDFINTGFPIRTLPDRLLFADPRYFSQLITSFFASESLGIPHTPLVTFFVSLNSINNFLITQVFLFTLFLQYVKERYPVSSRGLHIFQTRKMCVSRFLRLAPGCLYNRMFSYFFLSKPSVYCFYCLVEAIGVEPMTFCVQGRRSSQLS